MDWRDIAARAILLYALAVAPLETVAVVLLWVAFSRT